MEVYNPRIKRKGGPKLQRGPQVAGEDSALVQWRGWGGDENSLGAVPRQAAAPLISPFDPRPEALREALRAVSRAGSGLGSPRPQQAPPLPPLPGGCGQHTCPAPGFLLRNPRSSPHRSPGYFHRETRNGNSRGRLSPPTPAPGPLQPPWPGGAPVPPPQPLTQSGEQAGHAPDEEEDGADEAQLLQQHLPPLANFPQHEQHGLRGGERRLVRLHRSKRGRRGGGRQVGRKAGITAGGFPQTAPCRAGCSAERSRCPTPQVGGGEAEKAGGGGRGRGEDGGGGRPGAGGGDVGGWRGVALRGRAGPRAPHAPWPAVEGAARRRPALLWQPRAASQHRGTAASMRLPARPGQVWSLSLYPPARPPPPPPPAGGGRWAKQPPPPPE